MLESLPGKQRVVIDRRNIISIQHNRMEEAQRNESSDRLPEIAQPRIKRLLH